MFYETLEYPNPQYPVIFHHHILNEYDPCVNAHWHENYELLYILSGEMHCILDGRKCCARAGETVIVNSGVMHYLEAETATCEHLCLLADPDWLYKRGLRPAGLSFSEIILDDQVGYFLCEIKKEHTANRPMGHMVVLSLIDQLFVYLARNYLHPTLLPITEQEKTTHSAVKRAIRYIHSHAAEALTLEDISRQAGFTRNYFCRLFSEYTGLPPMRYLNQVRCEEAQKMLLNGDCTVSEAAHRCGFLSVSHFSQNYQKAIGHAPSKDRKKAE